MEKFDIIVAGVGGQGTMLAAKILGEAAILSGLRARGSELLGMSQRGGAVWSHIRIGSDVEGPLIMEGAGDLLLGFEFSEALRRLNFLSRNGLLIVNTRPVIPYMVSMGKSRYPSLDQALQIFQNYAFTVAFDATELAERAGSSITVNTVMLGAFAALGIGPISPEKLLEAIERSVKPATMSANRRAYQLGFDAARRLTTQRFRESILLQP